MCSNHAFLVEEDGEEAMLKCSEHAGSNWVRRAKDRIMGISPKSVRAKSVGFEGFNIEKREIGVEVTPSLAGARSKSANGDNNSNSVTNSKPRMPGVFK